MKILFIMRDLPYPLDKGYKIRNFYLLKKISHANKPILLCPENADNAQEGLSKLREFCFRIEVVPKENSARTIIFIQLFRSLFSALPFSIRRRFSKKLKERIEDILKKQKIDLIICDSVYQSSHIPLESESYKLLSEHNVESEIFHRYAHLEKNFIKKIFAFIEYRKLRSLERKVWQRFDHILAVSHPDKRIIGEFVDLEKITVIPNGVDTRFFNIDSYPQAPNMLVFTGQIGWYPNEEGVVYFIKEIFPLIKKENPGVNFWVVGGGPRQRLTKLAGKNPSIIITGYVDDVRPYIGRSSIYVVPLRMGSGTRLKILEAMAMGKAIVSTSVGCEGLEVKNKENILIADSPQDFAHSVISLLKDTQLRKRLGENARKLVQTKYAWEVVCQGIEKLVHSQ